MFEESKRARAQEREAPEPWEGTRPVPWLVIGTVAGLFLWAMAYIWLTHQANPPAYGDRRSVTDFQQTAADSDAATIDGGKLYAAHCAACHQAGGGGVPGVFPPLAGSEWVQGPAAVLTQILLHGVSGELTVKGAVYNGEMPAFGQKLNDHEIAALATHIRQEFGNTAEPVSAGLVAEQRTALDRDQPWQGDSELSVLQ